MHHSKRGCSNHNFHPNTLEKAAEEFFRRARDPNTPEEPEELQVCCEGVKGLAAHFRSRVHISHKFGVHIEALREEIINQQLPYWYEHGFFPSGLVDLQVTRERPTWEFPKGAIRPQYVYLFRAGRYVKIGLSTNPLKRLPGVQTGCPLPVKLLWIFKGSPETETKLHKAYGESRTYGEWFDLVGPLGDALSLIGDEASVMYRLGETGKEDALHWMRRNFYRILKSPKKSP